MADVPYRLSAETLEDLQAQTFELIRQLFEERLAGANLGDVFAITGGVLTLVITTTHGLEKSNNSLQVKLDSSGGLDVDSDGIGINLDGSSLTVGSDGLKVTEISSGWSVTNKTPDRVIDCDASGVDELADVLGTLIDDLKGGGYLGS